MTTDYDEGYVILDHEEFLEQAWEAYRATTPRPRQFLPGVYKYHSYLEMKAERAQRVIDWFLSITREIVN
jgi:hypothetical protein